MTPETYCRNRARGSGSSFFYAFLFLPEQQRRAMIALYAFCREVDDIADEISEQEVALAKLAFWREEIGRAFAGNPQHPVGRELAWTHTHFPIDEELLVEILDGMLMDVRRKPILKASDLSLYIYRVAGVVGLLSIEIFGYEERQSRNFATTLGEALQLTNIMRDLAEDAAIGRIYLPQQERIGFQVPDQAFKSGEWSDGMQQLLHHYAERTEQTYQRALEQMPKEDRKRLRPSIIMAAIYYAYLKELNKIDYNVWQQPVYIYPIKKIWIAWRAWRYEKRAEKKSLPLKLSF